MYFLVLCCFSCFCSVFLFVLCLACWHVLFCWVCGLPRFPGLQFVFSAKSWPFLFFLTILGGSLGLWEFVVGTQVPAMGT